MNKIVVLLAHARTGTHMLRSILSQESWLRNFDEVFNPAVERWNRHSFFPHLRQHLADAHAMDVNGAKQLVDSFFDRLEASVETGSGLVDLKVGQLGAMNWPPFLQGTVPIILDRVIARRWPIVLCRRRDQLAAYVSQKQAERTGVWVRRTDALPAESAETALRIAPDQLLRYFEQQARAADDVDRWLSNYGRKALIHYEDFASFPSLPDPVREVFSVAFGRQLRRGTRADTVKLVADHRAVIANPEEVRATLVQAGCPQLWPEDGAQVRPAMEASRREPTAGATAAITSEQARARLDSLAAEIASTLDKGVADVAERHALANLAIAVGHFDDRFVHRAKGAPFADFRLGGVASFNRLMFQARRRDYLSDVGKDRWLIDDKLAGLTFAQQLGVPVAPYILCTGVTAVPEAIARIGCPAVVKPLVDADANNVFMVFRPDHVVEHKTRVIMDEAAALARMERTGRKKWLVQKYIGPIDAEGPPVTEIKPFMFYGEVGFIQEVTTFPELGVCEWSLDGQVIDSGRVVNRIKGQGFTPELVEDAVRMSLAVPTPFLRIDFLVWQGKHYFNEVAPQPGSATQMKNFDRFMGDLYLAAEARLFEDLLTGKSFPDIIKMRKMASEMRALRVMCITQEVIRRDG